jgi:hypothetical protein
MPNFSHAGAEAWNALSATRERQADATLRRHIVRTVDGILDELEEVNLDGRGRIDDPLMGRRLCRVEAQLGRRLPAAARQARTAKTLHEALLDWLDELLDEVVDGRAALARFDAETWPEHTGWARPGQ